MSSDNKKVLKLDLDGSSLDSIKILEPAPPSTKTLSLTENVGDNPASLKKKDKKNKKNKPAPTNNTSIIDSILKIKKQEISDEPGTTASIQEKPPATSPPLLKKKLILDMNNDSHIISETPEPKPIEPTIQPLFTNNKPVPTITLKCEEKKRTKTPDITPESSQKLVALSMLDSASPPRIGQATEFNNKALNNNPIIPRLSPVIAQDDLIPTKINSNPVQLNTITAETANQNLASSTANLNLASSSANQTPEGQALKDIEDQLVKVRKKLLKKPDDAKYIDILAKLEARREKYIKRLAKHKFNKKTDSIDKLSETNPDSSNIANNIISETNLDFSNKSKNIISELDAELLKTRELLSSITVATANTKPGVAATSGTVQAREAGTSSLFSVPNELASMKERKQHLLNEQKKMADKLAHRQKQIDRIKTWQREIGKLSELQKEKQKLYELQQGLKKLEKLQYAQDQQLKQQMYQFRKSTHFKTQQLKNEDIKQFNSCRERYPPTTTPVASTVGSKILLHPNTTTITNPNHKQTNSIFSGILDKLSGMAFFNNLGKIIVGERVFFNNKNAVQQIPVPTLDSLELSKNNMASITKPIIPETKLDSKTGLEFFTVANTPLEPAPVEPAPEPAPEPVEPAPVEPAPVEPTPTPESDRPVDIYDMSDDILLEQINNKLATNNGITSASTINNCEIDIAGMTNKLSLGSGLDKILSLTTNNITSKTEKKNITSSLLNIYNDITDTGLITVSA